jgi:hypothetical protein
MDSGELIFGITGDELTVYLWHLGSGLGLLVFAVGAYTYAEGLVLDLRRRRSAVAAAACRALGCSCAFPDVPDLSGRRGAGTPVPAGHPTSSPVPVTPEVTAFGVDAGRPDPDIVVAPELFQLPARNKAAESLTTDTAVVLFRAGGRASRVPEPVDPRRSHRLAIPLADHLSSHDAR